MNEQLATEILNQHGKRATQKRVALLEVLMESTQAFTLSEIDKRIAISIDRVTTYRILHCFELIGLVTKMVDRKGTCMYMYNHEVHRNNEVHPHLHCKSCKKVVCLPSLPKAYMNGLNKHKIDDIYFIMDGVCSDCITVKVES